MSVVINTQNASVIHNGSDMNSGAIAGLAIGCTISAAIIIIVCIMISKLLGYCKDRRTPTPSNPAPLVSVVAPPIVHPPKRVGHRASLPVKSKPKVRKPNPIPNPLPILDVIPKPRKEISSPVDNPVSDLCPKYLCRKYIRILELASGYFSVRHDRCYCSLCYPAERTSVFTTAGSQYTVPRGWTNFGLQIDVAAFNSNRIFSKWFTTFYGTSRDDVELIIRNRFIPFSGDNLLGGSVFTRHISDKAYILSSPSINYASLERFCPTDTVLIDHKWYDMKIVLACKQYPLGLVKQRGFKNNVCRIIPEHEIEWKTDQRAATIPYGVLIRVQDHRCNRQCRSQHSSV
ncbi:unnamed protein product [Rotaria magnacalcarata]|uniref:Uncharacterized protein n=3 Tax=Rotaria magnacalcarata TaxID=392030 RepID=A0A816NWH7_9BILA|nr:unnamed protein product [Rotaria magnacalcarata]CAF1610899.1 unnamed protein product [Rotaria magnacalcarata]CAF2041307.1 unnamed protein product [Rotaria magnacalcarata]